MTTIRGHLSSSELEGGCEAAADPGLLKRHNEGGDEALGDQRIHNGTSRPS
jgi:hypothetical protein